MKFDVRRDAKLAPHHVDAASGALMPEGWTLVRPLLLERARAGGRTLGCVVMSIDAQGAMPGHAADARDVPTLARWALEGAPAGAQLVRLNEHTLALVAVGLGVEGAQALGQHLLERVRAQSKAQDAGAGPVDAPGAPRLNVSIGIDALPADSPGAGTLVERAAQAMSRVRREGGDGMALFAPARPPRRDSAAQDER